MSCPPRGAPPAVRTSDCPMRGRVGSTEAGALRVGWALMSLRRRVTPLVSALLTSRAAVRFVRRAREAARVAAACSAPRRVLPPGRRRPTVSSSHRCSSARAAVRRRARPRARRPHRPTMPRPEREQLVAWSRRDVADIAPRLRSRVRGPWSAAAPRARRARERDPRRELRGGALRRARCSSRRCAVGRGGRRARLARGRLRCGPIPRPQCAPSRRGASGVRSAVTTSARPSGMRASGTGGSSA